MAADELLLELLLMGVECAEVGVEEYGEALDGVVGCGAGRRVEDECVPVGYGL